MRNRANTHSLLIRSKTFSNAFLSVGFDYESFIDFKVINSQGHFSVLRAFKCIKYCFLFWNLLCEWGGDRFVQLWYLKFYNFPLELRGELQYFGDDCQKITISIILPKKPYFFHNLKVHVTFSQDAFVIFLLIKTEAIFTIF